MVDLEDDELELDQQGNPKPKPQSIGTPIQPTMGVPGGSPAPSKFQDVSPIMPKQQPWESGTSSMSPTPISPDATPQAPAGAGSIGSPISPYVPAPRPAAARAEAMAAQGPPEYHGFNKFLDTLGRVTAPGQAIEEGGGYGTLGYGSRLDRANTQAKAEEQQIEGGEKERQAKATLEETQARTGKEQQQTEASKAGMTNVIITGPNGEQYSVPQSQLGPDIRAKITGEYGIKKEGMRETAAQQLQSGKPVSLDQLASQAIKENDNDTLKKIQDFKTAIAKAGKSEPGSFIPVNDGAGNIVGYANPKTRDWVPAEAIGAGAASTAAGGTGGALPGGAFPAKPGQMEQRMGKMAQYTNTLIDDTLPMIEDARNQLGPGAGRWAQFTAGSIGLKNVQWTGIDTQLTMVTGALTLAHAQGRISSAILDQFTRLLNAGKQDPDNLIEALKVAKVAMAHVQETFGGQHGSAGGGGAQAPTEKSTWQQTNGKYRYSNDGGKTWNNYTQP